MAANFDGLARWYHTLELSSFGLKLEYARFAHIGALKDGANILLLGDGDGRFLKRLLKVAPAARVHSVDASGEMLAMAQERVRAADAGRVTFTHADALAVDLPPNYYDAVVTVFFLDCFTPEETRALVDRVSRAVREHSTWLFVDFAIPDHWLLRPIARVIVAALYAFFRWRTGITATHLPESEREICRVGYRAHAEKSFVFGLLRSVEFQR